MPADTHVHLAWKILIKNSVMRLDIQVKMRKNISGYIVSLSLRKKKGMKRVGACYKKIGSRCLCFIYAEITFLAVAVIAE